MIRFRRIAIGLSFLLAISGREAHAQWGYGGWGWGGWGATPQSSALQGAGNFAMGAGMYNLDTAQARSINAQTAMQWNDYVAQVTHESAQIHAARVHTEFQKNQKLYNQYQQRLRDNPGKVEIEDGSALNVALDDLTSPRIGESALRAASAPVPASLVAEVPFVNNAERVTLMLDHLRGAVKWPDVFEGERFARDKETFEGLVARVRKEAQESDEVSPKTLRDAGRFIDQLSAKVETQPLADPLDQQEAEKFITTSKSLLGLLAKPDIQPALLDLRKVQDTTVANLLGFMHAYNLRFGRATTPKQRQAYYQLFSALDRARDQIQGGFDDRTVANATPAPATEFFGNLNKARPRRATAPPPQPGNPR